MGLYPPVVSSNPPVATRRYRSVEFFVDTSNGSDDGARPGDRPEKPLKTIKEAIARCNAGEMNIISVINAGHTVETTPIVIDKNNVTIRGFPSQNPGGSPPCTLVAPTDTAYFTINARDVVIRDFTIHAGVSWPAINHAITDYSYRTGIHNITFKAGLYGYAQGTANGAGHANESPSHEWAVTNCRFLAPLANGIYLDSNGSWGLIADNFFEYVGVGITAAIGCQSAGVRVLRNLFMTPTETGAEAIYLGNQTARWFVADNVANDASITASGANPFRDDSILNAWHNNYIGNDALGTPDLPT